MQVRLAGKITMLAAALAGCGGQRVPTTDHRLPAAIATPPNDAALLRVVRGNGKAELLRANTLVARQGLAIEGLPAISRVLGANVEDETVYATDNAGRLVAIDLKSQRSRTVPTSARQLTATPDGTILGIDSAHHPVRLINRAITTYKVPVEKGAILLRAPSDQIVVVGNRPGTLQVLGSTGELRHLPIPNGRVTSTWMGDLIAVSTDSGVLFVDPNPSAKTQPRKAPPKFVKVNGTPTVAVFSPSGHRLYVARKTGGLVMLDRFTRTRLKELPLAGTVAALRADRSGHWLLAHGQVGDSLWVIDVTRWVVAWRGAAPWADDLPQVADGRLLLIRRKGDVLSIDLAGGETPERGVLAGGSADLYIMLPWVPMGPPGTTTAAAQTSLPAANPSATAPAAPPSTAPATPALPPPVVSNPAANATASLPNSSGTLYVQVSSSQNADWAQALAKQLKEGGFPARVLAPKTSDESYRVVIGPYATRDEADAVGKRLGRPYFIVTQGSGDT